MRKTLLFLILLSSTIAFSQDFIRTELPTELTTPWEITMGPDGFLWITEAEGKVSRVNPNNGDKQEVYLAPDYFAGDISEQWPLCSNPNILPGTLGLALHPDFMNSDSSYIYFVYSYNSATPPQYRTRFKIVRLKWDIALETITTVDDIVLDLPTGYDHLGGRLISATINNSNYLFLSIGDLGISEDSHPDCYTNQADNPNNFTQHPDSLNGKIHRFNMDGSIPFDNPIAGNSFYTRGHRNPQGLAFNPDKELIYAIEHGDRTDDEINLLSAGMNYGWKTVRGYHFDGSYNGEDDFVNNYTPHPSIPGDQLIEPMHSWCTDTSMNGVQYNTWCTVAPSDGEYYNSYSIYEWYNSLVVVTLKDGDHSDRELHVMHLSEDGESIESSETFFGEDQALNGRLRDITFSNDGYRVYLINNGGTDRDKITVYTRMLEPDPPDPNNLIIYSNPSTGVFNIVSPAAVHEIYVFDKMGRIVLHQTKNPHQFSLSNQAQGNYNVKIVLGDGEIHYRQIMKI